MDWAAKYFNEYVAEDGGGKLSPNDVQIPFKGKLSTTKNENPILFLVQSAMELIKHQPESIFQFKALYEKHMSLTEILPGLHSRRPGDEIIRRQSHDNFVAMVIGGWLFQSKYAKSVYEYGRTMGWNYNVRGNHEFDIKSQIQGGDEAIAFYANGFIPPIWSAVWLSIGLAISKVWNLADLRIEFLEAAKESIPVHHRAILELGVWIHKLRRGPRIKWVRAYFTKPGYPFREVLEESLKAG